MSADYSLMRIIGSGSYGQVVQARHRKSGTVVAIKFVKQLFDNQNETKKQLRELHILRKMTQMPGNVFTTKIYDAFLADDFSHMFLVLEFGDKDLF